VLFLGDSEREQANTEIASFSRGRRAFVMSKRRRQLLFRIFLVLCFHSALVDSLQSAPRLSDRGLPDSVVTSLAAVQDGALRSSPAAVAIQDGDAVRRILKQRSNRGKTRTPKGASGRTKNQRNNPSLEASAIHNPRRRPKSATAAQSAFGRPVRGINLPYESTVEALKVFHLKHDNLILPRRFVVPVDDTYPKDWHGIDLAGTVYDMKWWQKHVKQKPNRVAELNQLGFVWERLQPEWNLVLEGLVTYGILHRDLLVPSKFVIPYGDACWPKATWGIALGNAVYRIRNRGDFLRGSNAISRRDQLESLGFVWDTQEHRFEIFCKALRVYAQVEACNNGSKRASILRVPAQFVVPRSSQWPNRLWGYTLGARCIAVRQKELYVKGQPEKLKVLAELGFHSGGNDSLSWLEVVHAAAVYSQMHQRKLEVPANFVVPAPPRLVPRGEDSAVSCVVGSDEAWPWPGRCCICRLPQCRLYCAH
jgi:hypothetical protein